MMLGKRGFQTAINVVVGIVVVLLVALVVLLINNGTLKRWYEGTQQCPGYCAYKCEGPECQWNPVHNSWCQEGIYDVSGNELKDTYQKMLKKENGNTPDYTAVSGKALNLKCVSWHSDKKLPAYMLGTDLRKGEGEEGGVIIKNPPRIQVYLYDGDLPLQSGETVEMISGNNYKLTIEVTNVGIDNEIKKIVTTRSGGEKKDELLCLAYVKYENKPNPKELPEICAALANNNHKYTNEHFDPKTFFGSEKGTLVISLVSGERYDPYSAYDTRFSFTAKVVNPIKISGLTSAYTRSKELRFYCNNADCLYFYVNPVARASECKAVTAGSSIDETRNAMSGTEWAQPQSEGTNDGILKISDENPNNANNVDKYKDKHLCVYAITKDNNVYKLFSDLTVNIDREKPIIHADFKTMDLVTEVTCDDQPADKNAGCTDAIGYHYISNPVDFIGSLFSGVKNALRWCPQTRSQYSFTRGNKIPYVGNQDFAVLCVYAEDYAGNYNTDVLLVYNVYDTLAAIAQDQLAKGGYGTGYYGYG